MLFSAFEVVRLGEKKLLHSQEDWQFLSDYLLVINQNWPRYLTEQKRKAEQDNIEILGRRVEAAYKVLVALDHGQAGDVSQVIQQVADKFFEEDNCDIEDCIRLAQLAASLGASISDDFQFVTQDGYRRPVSEGIVYDIHNDLDVFVPDQWHKEHVLHEDYRVLLSCKEEEWRQWVASGRSGLLTFAPLIPMKHHLWSRDELRRLLTERGFKEEPYYPYVTSQFVFDDWDFDKEHWDYWEPSLGENTEFWGHLFARVLDQPKGYWSKATSAKASQVATTGTIRAITHGDLLPAWVLKFRSLPCLQKHTAIIGSPPSCSGARLKPSPCWTSSLLCAPNSILRRLGNCWPSSGCETHRLARIDSWTVFGHWPPLTAHLSTKWRNGAVALIRC